MHTTRNLAGAALVTLVSAAPGPAAQRAMSTPAERPSLFAPPHQVTGQADTDTAPQLSTRMRGDRVTVSYKNDRGEMVATRISPA